MNEERDDVFSIGHSIWTLYNIGQDKKYKYSVLTPWDVPSNRVPEDQPPSLILFLNKNI